jgi:two-component system cell cycle sensor histidine kinase/response regulator CckA
MAEILFPGKGQGMKDKFVFLKVLAIVVAAVLFERGLRKWAGEPEGIAGILGSVILVSFFTAPLFYFFMIRPYRELAEQRVSLMNNLPGVVYRGHRDWSVSFMGAQVEQVTGYTAEELLDGVVRWKELIHPSDLDALKRVFRETVEAKKKELRVEYRILRKDGSHRWMADRRQLVYDAQGKFRHVDGVLLDITDRKRAEESLEAARRKTEEEKAKTEAIVAAIGDGISIQDRDSRVLYQNEVHKGIFGDQLGKFCYEAYEKKDHVCEGCPVAMAYRDGKIHTVERGFETEGGMKEVEITSSVLRDPSRNIVAGIEVVRDITARRRTEAERSHLAMAVDQSADSIVVTDREGTILYVNPAFERITGYSRVEAVGKNPRILHSGKHDASFYKELWSVLGRGEVWTGHFINRKKDGSLYEDDATISPLRDSSGKIVNYVSAKRDVTNVVSLEKQVRTAQRMESVGTLAGGIAHDFNNVLTVIIGYGEMLKSRIANDPKAISDLDEILRSAERAAVLTRQLLIFARRQIVELGNVDLNRVVTDLDKLLRKVTKEDIEIKTSLAEGLPAIRADQGQVEQVLMNLILNARDAMPGGGQIVIESQETWLDEEFVKRYPYMKAGRYAVLSVSDTGIGMDEGTRERIFEPFFTTKGPDRGTGLGLAVVYGIVKQHGGFIHVYSEPGKGTTFRIYFPVVDAPADPKVVAARGIIHGGSETILLAEDNEPVRHLTERMLISYGYRVLVACDGEEAVEISRRHGEEIAMVVLDVVMPKKGGKQAYDEMKKSLPGLKALFLSGYSADAIHDDFVLHPGIPFLQKPFDLPSLAMKVREVLDRK